MRSSHTHPQPIWPSVGPRGHTPEQGQLGDVGLPPTVRTCEAAPECVEGQRRPLWEQHWSRSGSGQKPVPSGWFFHAGLVRPSGSRVFAPVPSGRLSHAPFPLHSGPEPGHAASSGPADLQALVVLSGPWVTVFVLRHRCVVALPAQIRWQTGVLVTSTGLLGWS